MKKIILTLILSLPLLSLTVQAQQPRFTELRTAEEIENEEWQNKITSETELGNYILQLVSSKEKSDYDNQWVCVQVLDKSSRQLVQEMKLGYEGSGDKIEIDVYYIRKKDEKKFTLKR